MVSLPLGDLVEAYFQQRINRFIVRCQLAGADPDRSTDRTGGKSCKGQIVEAHLADPGRLRELLTPNRRIWLQSTSNPNRKTRWSAILSETENGSLVSLVSALPNTLVKTALVQKAMPELSSWSLVRSEYPLGRHRFDFLLQRGQKQMLLEIKSVTLVDNGVGLFPDAVTSRGRQHLDTLAALTQSGQYQGAVLFVAQRSDAQCVTAASHIDPRFAKAFTAARRAGVQFYGRSCQITKKQISLGNALPVLDPDMPFLSC